MTSIPLSRILTREKRVRLLFVEATDFTRAIRGYFGDDESYRAFQEALLADPMRGDIIQGCGGLRKVRWRDVRRGKGARGGLRIIYLYVPEAERILLLDVYDKDEAKDLSPAERRQLTELADAYRREMAAAVRRN